MAYNTSAKCITKYIDNSANTIPRMLIELLFKMSAE